MSVFVVKGEGLEDSPATILGRIRGNNGAVATQASFNAISYTVFNETSATPDNSTGNGNCTVATVVFDTLQTDAIWASDSTGYNFKHELAGTNFPTGNNLYRIEYTFTPSGGGNAYKGVALHYVRPLRGS